MIESENTQINPLDEKEAKNQRNKKNNINMNLELIGEDEKSQNSKEQQEINSEDENLGYNSKYTLNKSNKCNSDKHNSEDIILNSKASTISTANSQSEVYLEQITSVYPGNLKMENNEREINYTSYNNINFNRERLNSTPITNYFQGIDYYLRGIQPEKNDYTKSGNFVEKEKFFKDKDLYQFKSMKYKSFDLSEPKTFFSNKALKRIEENNIQSNNNSINFPQNKATQINIENKIQNSTINNINIINNQPMIMQMPQNYENGQGKFDMPMYYFRYCDFDFSKGIPMVQYIPKKNNELNNLNNSKNQGLKTESKEEEKNKKIPAILVPAPIFYNPMFKNPKSMYGKYQKKKSRPFTERQGDWICKLCKNLNFAFRNECNRCGVAKKDCLEIVKQSEDNENKNNKLKMQNKKTYKYKKNYSNQNNDKDYNQNQNQKNIDYSMNEKSFEE